MILSSACQQWPADQPGPAGKASRPSLSYTTLWDTIGHSGFLGRQIRFPLAPKRSGKRYFLE